MKKLLSLFMMLVSALTAASIGGVVSPDLSFGVSLLQARDITKRYFADGDKYAYYVVENGDTVNWTIFVDALPGAGWEHECYMATVERSTMGNILKMLPNNVTREVLPPKENISPIYGVLEPINPGGLAVRPEVASGTLTDAEQEAARRTYAIILNGGINKNANNKRSWNDCSFIYQTLVKKLGVPRGNVFVLAADGADPSEDMTVYDGAYASSPLDLDFDGSPDIQYAATTENLRFVISGLEREMSTDDHLLLFVVGGGGTINAGGDVPYIRLWGDETLTPYGLGEMLEPLLARRVTVNGVFGQSNGGGFIAQLGRAGCVLTSAIDETEAPSSSYNRPYSEFLYHWTSAVNAADPYGIAVDADLNGDGVVSMSEASAYASGCVANQAAYYSCPEYIGEELSFATIAESTNLYIKDDYADCGSEPNGADVFWDSPSIWLRNRDDGVADHEEITVEENGGTVYAYVKVHNRGKSVPGGTKRYVEAYWSRASTAIGDRSWGGVETFADYPTGGYLGKAEIGPVGSGDSTVVKFEWNLPSHLRTVDADRHQFSIAARICDKVADRVNPFDDPMTLIKPAERRAHAMKSVSVVGAANLQRGTKAYVRNISRLNKTYSLS
ncbi:MAG: hypothetical protein K2G30_02335, partial [Muribaculaceae bacterium]|nr:hypothetical protein [Muribaculaceae bacterium]